MVQIKFKKFGSNSAFGSFAPGDTLRTSEAMARHLVEEAAVAEYVQTPAQKAAEPAARARARARRER